MGLKKPYSPQRWDLCWAVVEFDDDPTKSKKRPILITDSKHGYPIAFKATHTIRQGDLEYQLIDWAKEGLRQPTVVRIGKIIDTKGTPLTYIGTLTPQDINNIKTICAKHNISLTRKTEKMRLINRNKLEEAVNKIGIADTGVNNMDKGRIDLDTSLHGEAPYTYVDAIKDHDETIDKVEACTKEIVDYADEVVQENQRDAHGKIKSSTELKKMKLAESLFEDYEPEQTSLTENIDEVDDEVIVEDTEAEVDLPSKAFVELPSFTNSWKSLGLTDDDLRSLQNIILTDPESAIALGSNVYKIRFKPVTHNHGKDTSDRVIYIDIIKDSKIYLVLVFKKADEANITNRELEAIRSIAKEVK